ncbi:MAG TPA: biotin/lipoyl-containing protein [Amycolatopsis sp.]|nr:biotin/lipoyl-containing protein [Amycolatopsis sp.]
MRRGRVRRSRGHGRSRGWGRGHRGRWWRWWHEYAARSAGRTRPAAEAVPGRISDIGTPRARSPDVVIAAPSVGVLWRAPSPGAPPFVEVGKCVAKGDTVGIVEVMKLMNNVVTETAGTVTADMPRQCARGPACPAPSRRPGSSGTPVSPPLRRTTPPSNGVRAPRTDGSLHRRLIPALGFALAELLDFEARAEACARQGARRVPVPGSAAPDSRRRQFPGERDRPTLTTVD